MDLLWNLFGLVLWLIVLGQAIGASVALARMKRAWRARESDLRASTMEEQHRRNVAEAKLSMVGCLASETLARRPALDPYRSSLPPQHVHTHNLVTALSEIHNVARDTLRFSRREVGHFSSLGAASKFAAELPSNRNAYILPFRLWDGDCYHVVYDADEGEAKISPAPVEVTR
jgi:hypothetical protein